MFEIYLIKMSKCCSVVGLHFYSELLIMSRYSYINQKWHIFQCHNEYETKSLDDDNMFMNSDRNTSLTILNFRLQQTFSKLFMNVLVKDL